MKCYKCNHPLVNIDLRTDFFNAQKLIYVSSWLRYDSLKWYERQESSPGTWVALKQQQAFCISISVHLLSRNSKRKMRLNNESNLRVGLRISYGATTC